MLLLSVFSSICVSTHSEISLSMGRALLIVSERNFAALLDLGERSLVLPLVPVLDDVPVLSVEESMSLQIESVCYQTVNPYRCGVRHGFVPGLVTCLSGNVSRRILPMCSLACS